MAHTILLADSDRTSLELMTAVLTRAGFSVIGSGDGNDAMLKFFETRPAVVVVASGLAGVDAQKLCGQLKAQNTGTRVVLLRSDHGQSTAGVDSDGVLTAPFRVSQLQELLAQWGLGPPAKAAATPAPAPPRASMKFELPPPVTPPDLGALTAVQATAALLPPGNLSVPPLPTPIPLPIARQAPAVEELPELTLDDVVVSAPAAAPAAARSQASTDALGLAPAGDLAKLPLPRLLYEIYLATFSGVVHISHSAVTRSIYFHGGLPVRVDSQQLNETLGRVLVEHGRITMEQYSQSLELMQQRSLRQGDALVEIGALTKSELLDALKQQTELKLASSFAWRDGTYRIDADTSFERETPMTSIHPLLVIWRGVAEHYDSATLSTYFGELKDRYIVAGDLFGVHFETVGPFLRDVGIERLVSGKTTFGAALNEPGRALKVAQALYVLLVTDMIVAAAQPGKAAVLPERPPLAPAPAAADPAGLKRISDALATEYLRLKECDYFDALRVDAASSPDEVDAAYQNIVSPLHLDGLPPGVPDDVVKRAHQIRDMLTRARLVLRDATLRDRYIAEQQQRYAGQPEQKASDQAAGPSPPGQVKLEVEAGDRRARIIAEKAYNEGLRLMELKKFVEAGLRFRDAVQNNQREPAYRVALGRAILRAEGVEQEASRLKVVTCLQQALQLDPSHIEANLDMAKLLVASGRRDRALAYVQRVLQRAPEHQEARQLVASLS